MKASLVLMKPNIDPQKAVAPDKGATAFFCSTGSKSLSPIVQFPAISHPGIAGRTFNCDLSKKYNFRRSLAKHPLALVIRTEGQGKPLTASWEVAV